MYGSLGDWCVMHSYTVRSAVEAIPIINPAGLFRNMEIHAMSGFHNETRALQETDVWR